VKQLHCETTSLWQTFCIVFFEFNSVGTVTSLWLQGEWKSVTSF